jgi:hypothetical protein
MAHRVGDEVVLTEDQTSEGFLGASVAKGTKGVVVKDAGPLSGKYEVAFPGGRHVRAPASAFRAKRWSD